MNVSDSESRMRTSTKFTCAQTQPETEISSLLSKTPLRRLFRLVHAPSAKRKLAGLLLDWRITHVSNIGGEPFFLSYPDDLIHGFFHCGMKRRHFLQPAEIAHEFRRHAQTGQLVFGSHEDGQKRIRR